MNREKKQAHDTFDPVKFDVFSRFYETVAPPEISEICPNHATNQIRLYVA